ncbi:MAG: hypothetical protein WC565_05475 [Parcubacteria group bacterium]
MPNKRIAETMDAISEHSVLVAPAPDGTILVTDAGETLIATSEGWKPWDPEHDIRCWHGPEGLLATIEERGKHSPSLCGAALGRDTWNGRTSRTSRGGAYAPRPRSSRRRSSR